MGAGNVILKQASPGVLVLCEHILMLSRSQQDSPYYEHFYKDMVPLEHYYPVDREFKQLQSAVENMM